MHDGPWLDASGQAQAASNPHSYSVGCTGGSRSSNEASYQESNGRTATLIAVAADN